MYSRIGTSVKRLTIHGAKRMLLERKSFCDKNRSKLVQCDIVPILQYTRISHHYTRTASFSCGAVSARASLSATESKSAKSNACNKIYGDDSCLYILYYIVIYVYIRVCVYTYRYACILVPGSTII